MHGAELGYHESKLINSTQHRQELAWGWLSRLSLAILLSGANLMLVFKVPSNKDFLSCSSAVSFLDSLVLSLSNEITLGRLKSGIFCSSSFMSHLVAQKSLSYKKKVKIIQLDQAILLLTFILCASNIRKKMIIILLKINDCFHDLT